MTPPLFADRSPHAQVILGGIVPAGVGAVAGVLLGISAAGYWAVGALAAVGAVLGGLEHADGWEAADRGLLAGVIYGSALLLVHELTGARPRASLGSVPALLIVVTAVLSALLSAAGGALRRGDRATRSARTPPPAAAHPSAAPESARTPRARRRSSPGR